VLRAAFELADSIDARVHVFHVVDNEGGARALSALNEVSERMSVLVGDHPATVEPLLISAGAIWRLILDAAQRICADVMVIGARARRTGAKVLGSTASRVVDAADRPVLVVHERHTLLHLIGVQPSLRN
jgi:nucleotide-binding universal stress UspA family protein